MAEEKTNQPVSILGDRMKHLLIIGGTAGDREKIMKSLATEGIANNQSLLYFQENQLNNLFSSKLNDLVQTRHELPEDKRRPLPLFFQFSSEQTSLYLGLNNLLSEARQLKLSITISIPTFHVLDEQSKMVLMGNIANVICLKLDQADAVYMNKIIGENFTENDLLNLPEGSAITSDQTQKESSKKINFS